MIRTSFRERRRSERRLRVGLIILALGAAAPALWGLISPRSFYSDFPGGGLGWVALFPPFNEHLVRDVASFYLGFAVLLGAAAIVMERRVTRIALLAWLAAAIPHLVFHAMHLEGQETTEVVGQVGSLALGVALPIFLLYLARRTERG